MSLLEALLAVVAPVFLVSAVGFVWGLRKLPFDHEFVTRIVTLIGAPSLVFVTLSKSEFAVPDLLRMGGATLACIAFFVVVATIGLRLAGLPLRVYLPSLAFPNIGNMGLPICLYAFGPRGLALAMIYFTVTTVCQFSFGPAIAEGRITLGRVLRTPFLYAALLAVGTTQFGFKCPQWLMKTLSLIGDMTVPLMLLGLGAALSQFQATNRLRQFILSSARLALGLVGGLLISWLFGLQGAERGVVIVESAMPVAVFNYLFARMYGSDPNEVAGLVLISTVLSYLTLPALVALVL